jgi:hypothetical protein
VAQLVEALLYKPEGRGFDSRRCHWNFLLTWPFRPHYDTGVDSASKRNEYQGYLLGGKGGKCVGLTTLPRACADCLEIWDAQPPGTLRACPDLYRVSFVFLISICPSFFFCCLAFPHFFYTLPFTFSYFKTVVLSLPFLSIYFLCLPLNDTQDHAAWA